MIKLEVEDYCHYNCEYFVPEVEEEPMLTNMLGDEMPGDTIIRCRYRRRCKKMIKYLTEQLNSEVNNE